MFLLHYISRATLRCNMIKRRMVILVALLLFLPLVAVVAEAEEQVQAPVFKEGDFWKFKIVEKPVPGFSSTAIQFLNGIFTLRHTARGRMWVQELVEDKEILLESDQY